MKSNVKLGKKMPTVMKEVWLEKKREMKRSTVKKNV